MTEAIRTPEVVRGGLARGRRPGGARGAGRQAARADRATGDWVAEGRDIGTVVAPDAEVKVFLTASPQERARRRAAELGADPAIVLAEQALRDERDSTRGAQPAATPPRGGRARHDRARRVDEVVGADRGAGPRREAGVAVLPAPDPAATSPRRSALASPPTTPAQAHADDYVPTLAAAGPRILDLGCGEGGSIDAFRAARPDVRWTGVDLADSPEVARRTRADARFLRFDGGADPRSGRCLRRDLLPPGARARRTSARPGRRRGPRAGSRRPDRRLHLASGALPLAQHREPDAVRPRPAAGGRRPRGARGAPGRRRRDAAGAPPARPAAELRPLSSPGPRRSTRRSRSPAAASGPRPAPATRPSSACAVTSASSPAGEVIATPYSRA